MSDDQKYMQIALAEAQKAADLGEIPIGAVLVIDDEIIAKAHNMRETWKDATAHAEMIVIREACEKFDRWRLSGATLYVTIEPCAMCAGAVVLARLRQLVYGARSPKAGAIHSLYQLVQDPRLNHQVEVVGEVQAQVCGQLMSAFFQQLRRGEVPKWS